MTIFDMGRRQPFFEDVKLIQATKPCEHRFTAHYGLYVDRMGSWRELRLCGSCGSTVEVPFFHGGQSHE